ncbi:MAG: hypothetical protein EBT95_05500 [Verrucomicrobia bacterium]|nr:hypothetical protein [Verrucomicrobiota bacterium]
MGSATARSTGLTGVAAAAGSRAAAFRHHGDTCADDRRVRTVLGTAISGGPGSAVTHGDVHGGAWSQDHVVAVKDSAAAAARTLMPAAATAATGHDQNFRPHDSGRHRPGVGAHRAVGVRPTGNRLGRNLSHRCQHQSQT